MNEATAILNHLGVEDAMFRKESKGANWNELIYGIEARIRDQIAGSSGMAEQVRIAMQIAELQHPEFNVYYSSVMRDLKVYAERYAALVQRRAGRTGVIQNAAEYTEYISLGVEFVSMSEEMAVVIPDTLVNMQEFHNEAMEIIRKRDEQDPSVISDVEVKEPVAEITAVDAPVQEIETTVSESSGKGDATDPEADLTQP